MDVSSAAKQDTTPENARKEEERRKAKAKDLRSRVGRRGSLQEAKEEAKR